MNRCSKSPYFVVTFLRLEENLEEKRRIDTREGSCFLYSRKDNPTDQSPSLVFSSRKTRFLRCYNCRREQFFSGQQRRVYDISPSFIFSFHEPTYRISRVRCIRDRSREACTYVRSVLVEKVEESRRNRTDPNWRVTERRSELNGDRTKAGKEIGWREGGQFVPVVGQV